MVHNEIKGPTKSRGRGGGSRNARSWGATRTRRNTRARGDQ